VCGGSALGRRVADRTSVEAVMTHRLPLSRLAPVPAKRAVLSTPRQGPYHRLHLEFLEDRRLLAARIDAGSSFSRLALDPNQSSASALIVQFKSGASSPGSLAAHVATAGLAPEWELTPGMRRVELGPGIDTAAALAIFQSDPNVAFAQPDHRVSLQLSPNDPEFGSLWGLDNVGQTGGNDDADIDAPEAWDVTTGSSNTVVAVIDTGVDYRHPDLAANIWVNTDEIPGNRIDDDRNGYVDDVHGYDFVNRDGDPMDDHYHGTHVAGTIGAVGDNEIGIAGVNWHVQIMALKFLDEFGGGYESDAIAALNYAVSNGASISNNSWGGGGESPAFKKALENAAAQGHIFVAAAGNDGWDNDRDAFYPASYDVQNVVAVAATDNFDELAWFSNYGKTSVDLAAPGVAIYSTFPTVVTPAMADRGFGPGYGTISGTSMATPHVAGVMALVRSLHPEWSYEQVIQQVIDTVDVIDGAELTITGGRLNAAAAVGNAPPDIVGPRVISTDPSGSIAGTVNHVRLRFNESLDLATITLADVVSLTGPGDAISVLAVVPVAGSNRQFDVTFAPQTELGVYTLVLGPDISDTSGNLLDQDRDGTGGEDPDDAYTLTFEITDILRQDSTDVPKHIDSLEFLFGLPTISTLTIGQNVAISDVNLQLEIYYPNTEELKIYLQSPAGTRVTLVNEFDTFGDYFFSTRFDDEATIPIGSGSPPYSGSYRPIQSLSAFDGQGAAGTWRLVVEAHLGDFLAGEGDLFAWSLEIEGDGSGQPPPPPPPPPPPGNRPPVAVDDSLQGEVNTTLGINPAQLLGNDTDPDVGDTLSILAIGANVVGGSVAIDASGLIAFTPQPDFTGQASFEYFVTDGFAFDIGKVTIGFAPLFQWHNALLAADVNNDGKVAPNDVVAIINLLNAVGSTPLVGLSEGAAPTNYVDASADNFLAPNDALLVINYLNASRTTSTSNNTSAALAASQPPAADIDAALLSLLSPRKSKGRV
jgi:serine protease